jgi:hypothetical protein
MKHPVTVPAALLLAVVVCLPSCVLKKPQTVKAAPPAPAPTASPVPAPPPAPLSIPQTNVHLPPPQPVSAEAAASAQPPEEPAAQPEPPRTTRRTRQPGPPKPVESAAPAAPPAAAPAPAAAPPEHPPIEEVTPAAEQKRFQDEAAARKREVHQLVDPIDRRRLNHQQRVMFDRIQSFLKQSDDAESRGEMRQASELAQRALVLARELKP